MMFKENSNSDSMEMSDVLCDFCRREWTEDIPMIEGHHGSCICGKCLNVGWASVIENEMDDTIPGWKCTMCLEHRKDPCYRSPAYEEAFICRRCIRIAAQALRKENLDDWEAPKPQRRTN